MKNKILVVLLTFCMIAAMAVTAMAGDAAAAASVNGVEFASLADAITAAQAGDTIVLVNTVELENVIEIPSGKTITLDLNGNTVTYNSTTQGEAMITNRGSLTINDSVGTGVINYNYTGAADSSYGKGNYTISNAGTLTVNGGKITIANLSGHAKYPIDNNSTSGNAVLVINGGHLYNYNTSAIRQFCNSTTNTNSVTINGGLIEGYCAIWIQNPDSKTVNGSLSITGGEIRSTAKAWVNGTSELKDVGSAIYCTIAGAGGAWSEDSAVSITGGTINENVSLLENAPAEINLGRGATYNGYVIPTYVAQIGDKGYATLQAAFDAVQDNETIVLLSNITFTEAVAAYNDGTYIDGIRYTGDKSFIVDFNGMTVTDDGCVNDYLIYMNNKGAKANEITFKNGTIVSKNGCWSTVCVNSSAATQATVLNLNGMKLSNCNDASFSGNPVVRARHMATVNVNDGTVITSNGSSYGIAANVTGAIVNIKSGATVIQQNSGTTGGNSVFAAVGGKGVINIYDGAIITSDKYGIHTMTTGTPVINVYGGTITAPVALKSSTNGGTGELATINVTGGTINGALETYTNNGKILISGGTFSEAVDEKYCAEGYISIKNTNGTYGVTKAPVETPKETVENIVDNIVSENSNLTTEQQEAVQDTVEEAAQEIQNNEALLDESYQPVEDHSDVEELEITLTDMNVEVDGTNNTTTTEITYNVEPKDENGNKVSQPSEPITFRLPVPSSIAGTYIEVYHEGSYYGMFEIKGTAPNRYVEITASNFSEWTLVVTEATPVAKIGEVGYNTLANAIAAANAGDTVTLLDNVTITELIKIEKAITLDLGGKKVTATSKKAFEIYANATIQNGAIEAANRCVDTRKAVELTLSNLTLVSDQYTSYGNPQPLTIGGSENGTKVTMTNVDISATAGYSIITFVKTELTATGCTIGGYNALYVKPGSENSIFNFVDCDLSGSTGSNDVEGNSFSTIAVRADDVTVNVDADSTVTASGNYCWAISLESKYSAEKDITGVTVTVAGTINGKVLTSVDTTTNTISVKAEYASELNDNGYGYVTNPNGTVTAAAPVAQVNDVPYATLAEAFAAVQNGQTITLLDNVNMGGATLTIPENATITLNLNGYTVSGVCNEEKGSLILIPRGATLNLCDNSTAGTGKISYSVGTSNVGYAVYAQGTLNHVSGIIEMLGNWAVGSSVYDTYLVTFNVLPIQPTIILTDANGNEITPIVPGTYELIDGTYSFLMLQNGFIPKTGTFTVAGEDMTLDVIIYLYIPQDPTYSNVIDEAPHGDVTVTPARAEKGDTVVIIADPDAGYEVSRVSVTDKNGKPVSVVVNRDGTFSFIQPANNVTVSVTFTEIKAPAIEDTDDTVESLFIDVDADAYYAEAVLWAVEKGITTGTSDITFSPNATCTRAQAVTFLWRAAGSPAPKSTEMPFDDVDEDAYYAKAVLWAVEKGITNGTSDTTFSPNAECTRAQIVTFLYRSQKSPDAASKNPFTDVDENAYYAEAVLWAVDNKITKGATVTTFAPDAECTRAQIVTFLYRCMGEE